MAVTTCFPFSPVTTVLSPTAPLVEKEWVAIIPSLFSLEILKGRGKTRGLEWHQFEASPSLLLEAAILL